MTILGISAFYHDSAAAIIRDGIVIAAAQEERFSRKKHDPAFPMQAARFCLEYAGCKLEDLDAVAFYDKPFLKFERLLETYCATAPRGLSSFLVAMPVWIKEKLFLKKIIYDQLSLLGKLDKKRTKLLFPEHHLSHAASAFYVSPFEEAAILTIDGVGEWATASIGKGKGKEITVLKEMDFPHSVGLLYSSFTYYCGFEVNDGEYKLMGLAPYGNRNGRDYQRFLELIRTRLVTIYADGSLFIHQAYFQYATGLRMTRDQKWAELFGFSRRAPGAPLEQHHCDLALAIQTITEEIILKMAREAMRVTGCRKLCMAGGVALNVVANGWLRDNGAWDELFIQPAAGDAGGSLGAALAAYHIYFGGERDHADASAGQGGSLLGTVFHDQEIAQVLVERGALFQHYDQEAELLKEAARLLAEGHVLGWHQGRMEFGPRALGSRSILADARHPGMQKKLNLKIKNREGFRPFAPIVPADQANEYFELAAPSPYMLFVYRVRSSRCHSLPEGYDGWNIMDKLYFQRSDIPAVTHVDYSARVQTVDKGTNERLWHLLQAFKAITGSAVLVNTSFNVNGEPIVNSPEDAYRCFMQTDMDHLVIGNYILSKKEQPK